jgi:UPF0755 protein
MIKKKIKIGLIAILAIIICSLAGGISLFLYTPISPGRLISVEIKPGTSAWKISEILRENNIVTNAPMFMTLAMIRQKAKNLRAGTYRFDGNHYPDEILKMLFVGDYVKYRLTIKEGYNIFDIAERLRSEKIYFSKEDFINIALSKNTTKIFGVKAPSMEGFLYPDTYEIIPHMTPNEIIDRMVSRFKEKYSPEMELRAKQIDFTELQVLTLASMIEKEAQCEEEKVIISSVFHNRLHVGMKLQSDPTAIYGLSGFRREIEPDDLRRDTPYNTYLYPGLPPGPICSPSKSSIKAALWPDDTKYLFFVSKGNGRHLFSRTFSEHSLGIEHLKSLKNQ